MHFESICKQMSIGFYCSSEAVLGGLLHKMYRLETDQGVFALKILNPEIMARPHVESHLEASEIFANEMISKGIYGIAAIKNKTYVQSFEDINYLLYPWIEGSVNMAPDSEDVFKMGELHALLHNKSHRSKETISYKKTPWHHYFGEAPWQKKLEANLPILNRIEADIQPIQTEHVMSHRDLDPKNILWVNKEAMIIDWEASGFIDPSVEVLVGALYWSYDQKTYSESRFKTYIRAYKSIGANLDLVDFFPYTFINQLGWLAYSLKRTQMSSEEEVSKGIEQTLETLDLIKVTEEALNGLKACLE